ncbi:hypothetical protein [Streptomyces sp. NPDC053431]|uniref:nSTAND1 domain-containing NTPase n=1 Tax=Streptomyces sp. NPDC053431 TaxID=3365703 RepID=UPI0037CFACB6
MSTAEDDDGDGRPGGSEAEAGEPSARSYASGRDMYVAEQGDLHLYVETPDGDRDHHTVSGGPVTDDCPYPGLAPFTAGQAERFHGRRRLLTELGERLAECHTARKPLVVVAPSGAGKTSLLQAGLWQDLDRGRVPVPGSRHWPRLLLTPTAHPVRELTGRLAELAPGPGERILVVIDQAEELFTLCADPAERQAFVELLARLADPEAQDGPLALVVLALRADFYARCAELPWLRSAVQNNQLLLPPMTRDELLDAIRLPARAAGLRLEPGLVEVLVHDFGATRGFAEPGALPLLAHALRATWQNRQGRLLTVAGYTGTGGVAHALGNSAERVYERLDPAGRRTARRLFLGMVTIGEDTADSRRRVRRDHLLAGASDRAAAEGVLAAFTARRLLVQERETVSLTHEALLSAWPRLHDWINDDRPRNLVLQDLDTAARAWHGTGREPDALYRGKLLARALEAEDPTEEDPLRRAFLDASVRLRKRSVRVRRRVVAVVVALVLVAATTAVLALRQRDTAAVEQRAALAARITAQADGLRAADPSLAARLDLVAHRLAPRPATMLNLFVDGNTVLPQRLGDFRRLVTDTAYRPDGRVLAAVDTGGVLRLWDVGDPARPKELGKPVEISGVVLGIDFSPDGRTLAASRYGTTAALWNVTRPARPVPVDLPLGAAGRGGNLVAFAPDGRTLVGSGAGGRMAAWSLADPNRPELLPEAPTGSNGAPYAFGPDGRTLAGSSGDHTVRIWDLAHPDRSPAKLEPPDPRDQNYRVAYRPDGRFLALSNDTRVWLWDLADPARPKRLPYYLPTSGSGTTSLAFSPDGRTLAVADSARTVRLWNVTDPAAPKARPALPTPQAEVRGLAFAPDGRTLAGGTGTGPVMVWHLPDVALPAAADDTRALAFAPDGRRLAAGGRDGTVRLWSLVDPARPRVVGTLSAGTEEVTGLAFGPDGRTLTVASRDARLRVGRWDIGDPARPRRLDGRALDPVGEPAALSPDGRTAVVERPHGVEVWGLAGPEGAAAADRALNTPDDGVGSLAVSSEGRVVVGHGNGDFSLWVGQGPSPVTRVTGTIPDMLAPQVLALAPDGRSLAKADRARLTTWDLADPARPAARGAVTGGSDVESLAFGPRGDVLAVGDADGTVRFTDPTSANALSRPLSAGTGRITALAFAPDGRTLAAAAEAQPVRLWSTDPDSVARWICRATGNVLTPAQWAQYVPGLPYDPPCGDQG